MCEQITSLVASDEAEYADHTDADLAGLTADYRDRIATGREDAADLMIEAFATAREAARRALELRPRDEQIMAATAMAIGLIADLPDGEGKTLACALAAYHASLTGDAVHVVAVGDLEAEQAARSMGPLYERLGVRVGLLGPDLDRDARREVYAADVVYGSASEFGFDLLRDDTAWCADGRVQRGLEIAIVDDAVTQLIETPFLPLTISGRVPEEDDDVQRDRWAAVADRLTKDDGDYDTDPDRGTVRLLEPGIIKLHRLLGVDELRPVNDAEMLMHLAAALESREFSLDTPPTGDERVLARIIVGGLLREYDKLSGASAGAGLQFEAFDRVYGLEVVPIPASGPVDDPGGPVRDPDALEEVLRFQQALDFQREEMLAWRAPFLTSDDPSALVEGVIRDFVKGGSQLLPRRYDKYDVQVALDAVGDHCPITITVPELMRADDRNAVIRAVLDDALEAYRRRAREFDTERLQDLARKVLLSAADRAWRRHLRREEALPASLRLLDARGDDPVDTYEEVLAESSILMTDEFTIDVVGYMSYLNLEWEGL